MLFPGDQTLVEGEVQEVGWVGNITCYCLGLNTDLLQGLLHRCSVNNNVQPKHNGGDKPMAVQRLHHNPASGAGASQSAKQRVHHHFQEGEEDGQHAVQQRPQGGHHHRDDEVIIDENTKEMREVDMPNILQQPVNLVGRCWRMWELCQKRNRVGLDLGGFSAMQCCSRKNLKHPGFGINLE